MSVPPPRFGAGSGETIRYVAARTGATKKPGLQPASFSVSPALGKGGMRPARSASPLETQHHAKRGRAVHSVRCLIWDKARPEVWIEIEIGRDDDAEPFWTRTGASKIPFNNFT